MRNLRKLWLGLMLPAVLCALGQLAHADDTLVMNPSQVTAGSLPPPVQISVARFLKADDSGLSTAKKVTVNGPSHPAALVGNAEKDNLTITPPALQTTGPLEVQVLDGQDKVLGIGHLLYVAPPAAAAATEITWHPWVLAAFAILLVFFPFSLMWTDIMKAYAFSRETRKTLMEGFKGHSLTLDELKALLAEFDMSPPGIPGLARATLALTLLLLLGLIIFYFLAVTGHDIPPGVDKFLTALTTALAAVIAFYFGTKAAQGNPQDSSTPPPQKGAGAPVTQTPASKTMTLSPASGKTNDPITITGSGFGSQFAPSLPFFCRRTFTSESVQPTPKS